MTSDNLASSPEAPEAREGKDSWACGKGRLRAFVAYVRDTYSLHKRLSAVRDGRHQPSMKTAFVAAATFFCGLLRIRSFNALEPKLSERPFVRLVGAAREVKKLCSADTLSRSLRVMDLESLRQLNVGVVAKAERNKVFREGWHGALRYVAIDGWEPISSYTRHCKDCLVRRVKCKKQDGTLEEVDQYYHAYVVAMLIDERFDIALDLEPLLPLDVQADQISGVARKHEGELTAARRLLRRVKQTYSWLDVVVADGLYPNGPFLTLVKELRMGAVIIMRKENDEPLKEALRLWEGQPAQKTILDHDAHERIELWDCPGLETLDTYDGPIRVVRGRVTDLDHPEEPPHTWCIVVTGKAAKLPALTVLKVARGRWHIENTAFNQWTQQWHFTHVFTYYGHGILALYWLFIAAFNLLTLFLYRQLRCYGRDRGKDVTATISRLIDEMRDDLAQLTSSPWNST
jgi:hypothetical protein